MLDQREFFNACVRIETELEPEPLLDACKAVERALGREPAACGTGRARSTSTCCCWRASSTSPSGCGCPHREVTTRRFVLVPLLELDPDLPGAAGDALAALGRGPGRAARRAAARRPWLAFVSSETSSLLVFLAFALAGEAQAATFCVDVVLAGCVQQPSVAEALVEAQDSPGLDTIRVGRRSEEFDVTDAPGEPVRVIGAGRRVTQLGRADLGEDRSSVSAMTLRDDRERARRARRGDRPARGGPGAAARRVGAALVVGRGRPGLGGPGAHAQRAAVGTGSGRRVRHADGGASDRVRRRRDGPARRLRRPGEPRQLARVGLPGRVLRDGRRDALAPAGERRGSGLRRRPPTCGRGPARRSSTPATRGRSTPTSPRSTRSARCGRSTATATAPRGATSARSSGARPLRR